MPDENTDQPSRGKTAVFLSGFDVQFTDRVTGYLREVAQGAACRAKERVGDQFIALESACESEIERLMLLAFMQLALEFNEIPGLLVEFLHANKMREAGAAFDAGLKAYQATRRVPWIISIIPQYPIGGYRVDFMVRTICVDSANPADWSVRFIAVECDGREFHRATAEQEQRDTRRDRDLLKLGVPTMRWSGAELWDSPRNCAAAVYKVAVRAFGFEP